MDFVAILELYSKVQSQNDTAEMDKHLNLTSEPFIVLGFHH